MAGIPLVSSSSAIQGHSSPPSPAHKGGRLAADRSLRSLPFGLAFSLPPCGRAPAVSVLPEADTSRPEHPAAHILLFSLIPFLGPFGPNPVGDFVPLRLPLRPPQAPGALGDHTMLHWSALAAWGSSVDRRHPRLDRVAMVASGVTTIATFCLDMELYRTTWFL